MPVFECQSCDLLTENPTEAKNHNSRDPNHFFKRIGEHTYLDIKVQQMFRKALIKDGKRTHT